MWIILLDRSGSMADPFEGASGFEGRSRTSAEAIKLAAAKEALLLHLRGLGRTSRIAIVAFNEAAKVIFEGSSDDDAGIQFALESVKASGGTSLAAALDEIPLMVEKARDELFFRALVVSDGLSDLEPAEAAAQRVVRKGVIIDAILIDPTAKGEAVARAVAMNGNVSAVTSATELSDQIRSVGQHSAQQQQRIEELVQEYEAERALFAQSSPDGDRLAFTAWHPAIVPPETWQPLTVYLHLASLQAAVDSLVAEGADRMRVQPATSTARANTPLAKGTWLTLIPSVEGLTFNPTSISVAWYEDFQEALFRFRAAPERAGGSAFGSIDVLVGTMPIARLGVNVNVRLGTAVAQMTAVKTSVYQEAFASYSGKDAAIVDACAAVYRALGVYVYIDRHSIRGGQEWWPALKRFIQKSDIFQLFWSSSAAESEAVKSEYEHALSLLSKKGEGFIRPLYWEARLPKVPEALSKFHFTVLEVDNLRIGEAQTPKPSQPVPEDHPEEIYASVVPLLPGVAPPVWAKCRRDVSDAVRFLERVVGLRYYPVPTLLVDETVVREVRRVETIDVPEVDADSQEQAIACINFLRAMCLDFHVSALQPKDSPRDYRVIFGEGRLLNPGQFDWLKVTAEGFPIGEEDLKHSWSRALTELNDAGSRLGLTGVTCRLLKKAEGEVVGLPGRKSVIIYDSSLQIPENISTVFQSEGGRIAHRELSGPMSAFARLLNVIGSDLASRGYEVDSHDTWGAKPLADARECQGLAQLASSVASEVLPNNSQLKQFLDWGPFGRHPISTWYQRVLFPRWRTIRQGLIDHELTEGRVMNTLPECMEVFLRLVSNVLREGLGNGGDFEHSMHFAVSAQSWRRLRKLGSVRSLRVKPVKRQNLHGADDEEVIIEGQFSNFVHAVETVSDCLIRALPRCRPVPSEM
jgi:hypothetical protein